MTYPEPDVTPTRQSRFLYAMKLRNMSQEQLAEAAGCSQAAVQKAISGKTQKSKFLPDIARALGVDINWLELGLTQSAEIKEFPGRYHPNRAKDSAPLAIAQLATWDDETPLDDDDIELPIYKEVELASGHGRTQVQISEGRKVRFSRRTLRDAGVDITNAACATNVGNSNFPLILDKTSIGIDKGMTRIVDGQIYALDHDGLLRVKFLYRKEGGGLTLRSFNGEEYPDEHYSFDEIMEQRISILGRVFWWSTLNPIGSPPLL